MFNSKLKNQIEALEDRIWQLENPLKYKIGEKVNLILEGYTFKGIIVDIEFECYEKNPIHSCWKISVFDTKDEKIKYFYQYKHQKQTN